MLVTAMCEPHGVVGCEQCATPVIVSDSPPCRQTFVVELATDGDVTGEEVLGLFVAGGYHVAEVYQPIMRSVDNPKAFFCPTCETCHEPPLHLT